MILIDLNQVMISNLMAQSKGNLTELPSKDAVRHSILNTVRAFNVKFREEFGEMVLCADAAEPWRRDIFPNYKLQRRKGRVESQIDWDGLFKIMSDIREEFTTKLPYKVLHVDKTCRVQTVSTGHLYDLLLEFKQLSGHGILLNTSFNLAGEPLVETPEQAIITLCSS